MSQQYQFKKHIDDKMAIIHDYEDKFGKLKSIMHQKEISLSDLRAQNMTLDEQIQNRERRIEQMEQQRGASEDQIRTLKSQLTDKLDTQQATFDLQLQREVDLLKQQLKEKDKRLETIRFESSEQLRIHSEIKETDTRKVQEQLAEAYQQQ